MHHPEPISKLTDSFVELLGISPKTAQHLASRTLNMREDDVVQFTKTLIDIKRELTYYNVYGHIAGNDPYYICEDKQRDHSVTCIAKDGKGIIAIEKMRRHRGLYYVLHGSVSSMDDVGPEDINIPSLIERLKDDRVSELILAMNPDLEGEPTAIYISRLVRPIDVKVTRLARGLSVGGGLKHADEAVSSRAITDRTEM